ncbi:LacI family DNA-binding transcriptional regulator [Lactobacillus sp. PV034]|nr:LacI family DNA-binding transcriptional regulator [Lactobacillus sp. PV034]
MVLKMKDIAKLAHVSTSAVSLALIELTYFFV